MSKISHILLGIFVLSCVFETPLGTRAVLRMSPEYSKETKNQKYVSRYTSLCMDYTKNQTTYGVKWHENDIIHTLAPVEERNYESFCSYYLTQQHGGAPNVLRVYTETEQHERNIAVFHFCMFVLLIVYIYLTL